MKTLEQLLLHLLRLQVHHVLDPLQFAYQEKVGWKMPSSIYYTELYLIWTREVVLRIMFF
ncbi:hypothetical protein LDENG_00162450 [Lucifuga dentata]|nr:hypothetical protein LDENG_00162450 [Lucifuga dentata]